MNKFYVLFGLMLLTSTLWAQDSLLVTDQAKSFAVVSRLTRELSLNKTQQNQVYLVMQSRWNSIKELKTKNETIDWESINAATVSELKNILTLQQYTLFTTLKEETNRQKDAFKRQNPSYKFTEVDAELDF